MRLRKVLGIAAAIIFSIVLVLALLVAKELGVFRPKPAAHPIPAETRDGRWEQDVDYFASQLPRLHFDLFAKLSETEFVATTDELRENIPQLSDQAIQMEFARIVTSIGDGHTQIGGWLDAPGVAPIRLRWFSDGLFIVRASEDHEAAYGAEVLGIGGNDLSQVMAAVSELVPADNEPYMRRRAARLLRLLPLFHELGFTAHPDTAVFTIATTSGDTVEQVFVTQADSSIVWAEPSFDQSPLYLQRQNESYWFEYLAESSTVFFKYNRCRGREGFRDLAEEVRALIDTGSVDRMVIDFRGNGGGNSMIFDFYLLRHIKKIESLRDEGRLYSVIDVATFSSAVLNSIKLERQTNAITVGEPTGGKPNHFGEVKSFSLPNSGMDIYYSSKYFEAFPELGDAPYFEPEEYIPLSSSDYFSGRDPVMEWILGIDEQ